MQIVEGTIEHAHNRRQSAVMHAPVAGGQADPRHELIVNGRYIEIELDDKTHVLLQGHRVIIAGFLSDKILTGYAYKNMTTEQEGYSGSGGLALIFGGILSGGALAALYALIFSFTDLLGKILLTLTMLVLINFAYIIAGQPIQGWLAKRAIDQFSEQNIRWDIN